MEKIQELKKEQEKKYSELMETCGVFWAFSNEQFDKSKTPLQEGEKYISIGAGGYMPKGNIQKFISESNNIDKWYKSEIKKNKQIAFNEIEYELNNHECFYTGDISDAYDVLKDRHSKKDVLKAYYKLREKYQEA